MVKHDLISFICDHLYAGFLSVFCRKRPFLIKCIHIQCKRNWISSSRICFLLFFASYQIRMMRRNLFLSVQLQIHFLLRISCRSCPSGEIADFIAIQTDCRIRRIIQFNKAVADRGPVVCTASKYLIDNQVVLLNFLQNGFRSRARQRSGFNAAAYCNRNLFSQFFFCHRISFIYGS